MTHSILENISTLNETQVDKAITNADSSLLGALQRLGKGESLNFVFTNTGKEKTELEAAERHAQLREQFSYLKSALGATANINFEEEPNRFTAKIERVLNEQAQAQTA